MSESIFSAFGANAATVETDPFKIPHNKYAVTITGSEVKDIKDVPYWEIEYTITTPDSEQQGKSANNLLRLTPWTQAERPEDYKTMNARTIGSYKKALLELGIREDQLDTFNPRTMGAKIIGIKGYATIGPNKKGYNAIFDFERAATASASAPVATQNTEAATSVSQTVPDADALASLMGNLGG
jgi:hypothetical protein